MHCQEERSRQHKLRDWHDPFLGKWRRCDLGGHERRGRRWILLPQARRIDRIKNGWDFNDPSVPSTPFVYRTAAWGTPTTSWQWPDTTEWIGVDNWEGVDARIYIYNYMTYYGTPTFVRIDHARIRHT